MTKLQTILYNKHTTFAGALYVLANFLSGIGKIWLPEYKEQFDSTEELLESAAIGWGLYAAGDAGGMHTGPVKPNPDSPLEMPDA